MRGPAKFALLALAAVAPAPLLAEDAESFRAPAKRELPAYLQCVPYARQLSGVQIFGDAHTWWQQAEGRYRRGNVPQVGAVMAFRPHRNMRLGHVAAVSRIVDSRTVLLDHANWSPINGRRGQIERGVRAVDVSPANDWSEVRVWYNPLQALGKTRWPVHGFIYSDAAPARAPQPVLARAETSPRFLSAFSDLAKPVRANTRRHGPKPARQRVAVKKERAPDPLDAVLARYD